MKNNLTINNSIVRILATSTIFIAVIGVAFILNTLDVNAATWKCCQDNTYRDSSYTYRVVGEYKQNSLKKVVNVRFKISKQNNKTKKIIASTKQVLKKDALIGKKNPTEFIAKYCKQRFNGRSISDYNERMIYQCEIYIVYDNYSRRWGETKAYEKTLNHIEKQMVNKDFKNALKKCLPDVKNGAISVIASHIPIPALTLPLDVHDNINNDDFIRKSFFRIYDNINMSADLTRINRKNIKNGAPYLKDLYTCLNKVKFY